MTSLKDKRILISGASRGIGLAMAKRFAQDGAKITLLAKTAEPHPKLPGTVFTAAKEVEAAGGSALPIVCDVRSDAKIQEAVDQTVAEFGGLDILVNNASAISLTGTVETSMKRYDLMHQVNVRATYALSQACVPHLLKGQNPHILNNAPPLNMSPRWFQNHVAYTMTKYGMSMCTLGMAEEFRGKLAVNSLWPRTAIATAAIAMLTGPDSLKNCRSPEIMADAAYAVVNRSAADCTGNFFIDDEVLQAEGDTDLSRYAQIPDAELMPDFFLDAP